MKVAEMTKEALAAELKKTIKVRAIGDPDVYVGYYNHLRRRGGDVFILRPVVRDRGIRVEDPITKRMVSSRKSEKILITAEMQFSERWMVKVNTNAPETSPAHFNAVGRGRKRVLNMPGITSKVGGDDAQAMLSHDAGGESFDDPGGDTTTQKVLNEAGNVQAPGSKPAGATETTPI